MSNYITSIDDEYAHLKMVRSAGGLCVPRTLQVFSRPVILDLNPYLVGPTLNVLDMSTDKPMFDE